MMRINRSNGLILLVRTVFCIGMIVLIVGETAFAQDYSLDSGLGGAIGGDEGVSSGEASSLETIPAQSMEIKVEELPKGGLFITLPKLSKVEIEEVLAGLSLILLTKMGYTPVVADLDAWIPKPPEGIDITRTFGKESNEAQKAIRFAYRRYKTRRPLLWVYGAIQIDSKLEPNSDITQIPDILKGILKEMEEQRQGLTASNLDTVVIQLSYTTPDHAISMLKGLGVSTSKKMDSVPRIIPFPNLPIVVKMPEPKPDQIGIVGGKADASAGGDGGGGGFGGGGGGFGGGGGGGAMGLTQIPSVASPLSPETVSSRMSQLLVIFHPAHPEQLGRVRKLLTDIIDRPARQIFIEGMVLEISETGLKDLGAQFQFRQGAYDITTGSLSAGGNTDTANVIRNLRNTVVDTFNGPAIGSPTPTVLLGDASDFRYQIRALLREGKAEILSRPSVLTLNNRQATIRVGDDIPIATSSQSSEGSFSLSFQYIPTGILLNIRPRIEANGDEVSMLIDVTVSARVPGRDLRLLNSQGQIQASAPQISTRRVQTYARIPNNTPLIIGGLISKDITDTRDRVPFFGKIPILGILFRAQKKESLKREVIIVLTPYVLPENQHVARSLPKDEDRFDSFGNDLFRDVYRIRAEDTFDLAFLLENQRLQRFSAIARQLMDKNMRLSDKYPFKYFSHNRIPGEEILVHRMTYEVIKRLKLHEHFEPSRTILFKKSEEGGFKVSFLDKLLKDYGNGRLLRSFFTKNKNKALAITYHYDRELMKAGKLVSEPVPEVSLVDCLDNKAWGKLLWKMNQPTEDGGNQYTILIKRPKDLDRLSRAIMLKHIVQLNGGKRSVSLKNFSIGRVLLIPEEKSDQISVIDADVARYFFYSEHYYPAVIQVVENTLNAMEKEIQRPDIRVYLDDVQLRKLKQAK